MIEITFRQVLWFSLGVIGIAGLFIAALVPLAVLRYQRLWRLNYAVYPPKPVSRTLPSSLATQTMEHFAVLQTPVDTIEGTPNSGEWGLPIHEGSPEQMVIRIPPSGAKASEAKAS